MSDFVTAWAEPNIHVNAYELIYDRTPENRRPALQRANNRYNLYLNDKIHNLIIDYFDEDERGGDGNIDATDVIVSLNRSTMVPGFENIRRSDILYPYSTAPDTSRDEYVEIDTLIIIF